MIEEYCYIFWRDSGVGLARTLGKHCFIEKQEEKLK